MAWYSKKQYVDAYVKVRAVATRGKTISYSDLNERAALGIDLNDKDGPGNIGMLLGDISRNEHAHGRPMISAVVIKKKSDPPNPGKGFYALARELGLVAEGDDEADFFRKHLKAVYKFWRV